MADEMHLVRDLLDKQLVDANLERMGKADGIVIRPRRDGPPRVVAIEAGASVLADRIHLGLGRMVRALLRRVDPRAADPTRIPLEKILRGGLDIHLDVDGKKTSLFALERWLSERVIGRIPGADD